MRLLSLIAFASAAVALARTILNLVLVPRLSASVPRCLGSSEAAARSPEAPRNRGTEAPFLSVIIPARDEERTIERTVRAMLAQTYPALEVIVVNDRSTDRTGAILDSIDDPRLNVVQGEEPPPGWLGKPHALHLGSRHARGELLLFVDADVIYAPDAVAAAVLHIEESGAAMLALLPHFELHGFWEHIAVTNLPATAFTMIPLWLTNRTRIPLFGIGGGPGNLIRRDDYEAIGGHVALKDAVVDDIGLSRLARRKGKRTGVALANDFVSLRMYHGREEIVEGFTKNAFAVFGRSYLFALVILLGGFVTQVLPYVFALSGDPFAIATVALIVVTRVILFIALRYRLDNALFGHLPMLLMWYAITFRSMWVTGVRRQVRWRGRTYRA